MYTLVAEHRALSHDAHTEGATRPQKHKDPTNHDFWYPPHIGPRFVIMRSSGPLIPQAGTRYQVLSFA